MSKKITISDVAKKAGVGKVTVSYVLNGQAESARISKATADRVKAVASEMKYRPNALARMLVRKRTDAIGIVFQYGDFFGSQSSFISEVLQSVCQACVENQIDVMLHTKPHVNPLQDANALSDGRVDAVVVIRDENDPVHSHLVDQNFPTVLFFCRSDHAKACFVVCDNYNGGKMAANHLIGLGHTKIGMIRGGSGSVDSNDRFNGFRSAIESGNLSFQPEHIISVDFPSGKIDSLNQLMSKPERPSALFVWSDDDAIYCIRHLTSLGLKVPEDISIIGFDGTSAGERSEPPLTTVKQPIREISELAVRMAIDLADDPNSVQDKKVVVSPSIVIRGSTAPPNQILKQVFLDTEVNFK